MQAPPVNFSRSLFAVVESVGLSHLAFGGGFLDQRRNVIIQNGLVHGLRMLESTGSIEAFTLLDEEPRGYVFRDSDLFKWLEACAYVLAEQPNHIIANSVIKIVKLIEDAQDKYGYINSSFPEAKKHLRFVDLKDAHEIYCLGHLIQAGIAFRRAGLPSLFDIALRAATCLESVGFCCGHPVAEMALIELYRETMDTRWLVLSKKMLDSRGKSPRLFNGLEYYQDHLPVVEQFSACGHAVRALYLYCGMTDYFLETGDRAYSKAVSALWHDVFGSKMYLTGGTGARHEGEAFGEPYELPNETAYCESCAAIASMQWNWRMFGAFGETKYWDEIERVLYNGFLSSFSEKGTEYFYTNPLEVNEFVGRKEWFACACCPPNIMRTMLSLHSMFFAMTDNEILINHFEPMTYDDGFNRIQVVSDYPWGGDVLIRVWALANKGIRIRIPSWCTDASVTVNDEKSLDATSGWFAINRNWKSGDQIRIHLSMPVEILADKPEVIGNKGLRAVRRGPIVYCSETLDGSEPAWSTLHLGKNEDLLNGVVTIGERIPYFAWGNRGPSKMKVWQKEAHN